MGKIIVSILLILPLFSYAEKSKCAIVGGSMEQSLFDSIIRDLNIDEAVIRRNQTKVQVINISPVAEIFANQLARIDYEADRKSNGKAMLNEEITLKAFILTAHITLQQNIPTVTIKVKGIFSSLQTS